MEKIKHLDRNMMENSIQAEENLRFYNVADGGFFVSGLMAFDQERSYSRIPKEKRELLHKVNPCLIELGDHTAGGQISFRSDTKRVVIRATLFTEPNMANMTPVGQCGFDCYVGTTKDDLTFFGITRFDSKTKEYQCEIIEPKIIHALQQKNASDVHEFVINLPLYSNVVRLEIGIDSDAVIRPPSPYARKGQLVFYGTSITQGGCASRPGMAYTNILSRRLNVEHLNFGFSGNGLGEYEVANMLAQVSDPLMYVIDYEANSGTNGRMIASLEGFLKRIRQVHPTTPILILSRIPYVLDDYDAKTKELRTSLREFQREIVEKQKSADHNLYFMNGKDLFPEQYQEFTVDVIHPTDLGFYFMAENLIPVIKEILQL